MMKQSPPQTIRVIYPTETGRIVLRDWDSNVEAQSVSDCTSEFAIATEQPFFYFKPVLVCADGAHWPNHEAPAGSF